MHTQRRQSQHDTMVDLSAPSQQHRPKTHAENQHQHQHQYNHQHLQYNKNCPHEEQRTCRRIVTFNELGMALHSLRQYEEALTHYKEALCLLQGLVSSVSLRNSIQDFVFETQLPSCSLPSADDDEEYTTYNEDTTDCTTMTYDGYAVSIDQFHNTVQLDKPSLYNLYTLALFHNTALLFFQISHQKEAEVIFQRCLAIMLLDDNKDDDDNSLAPRNARGGNIAAIRVIKSVYHMLGEIHMSLACQARGDAAQARDLLQEQLLHHHQVQEEVSTSFEAPSMDRSLCFLTMARSFGNHSIARSEENGCGGGGGGGGGVSFCELNARILLSLGHALVMTGFWRDATVAYSEAQQQLSCAECYIMLTGSSMEVDDGETPEEEEIMHAPAA
jgi:tetratricopeptide (TPR) repeat protein